MPEGVFTTTLITRGVDGAVFISDGTRTTFPQNWQRTSVSLPATVRGAPQLGQVSDLRFDVGLSNLCRMPRAGTPQRF